MPSAMWWEGKSGSENKKGAFLGERGIVVDEVQTQSQQILRKKRKYLKPLSRPLSAKSR